MRQPTARCKRLLAAVVLLAQCSLASALDGLQLSGFGTIGLILDDDDRFFFNRPGKQQDAPGRNHSSSGDSLLGLQGTLGITPSTDATVQVLIEEDHHNDLTPRLSWAFIRHELQPDLTLRAGRMRAPSFMHSDSLNVNFASPWVRPPIEVYSLHPFSELNGVDLLYRTRIGRLDVELQPYLGSGSLRFPDGSASLNGSVGISADLRSGDLRLRLGHAQARFDLHYGDPLFLLARDSLVATGRGNLVSRLSGDDGRVSFSSVGFQWNHDALQLSGELAYRRSSKLVSSGYGWHLTATYQRGAFTPYLTLAQQTTSRPVLDGAVAHEPLIAAYLASRSVDQRSVSIGVRWDIAVNAALKLQWSRSRVRDDAWGAFFPVPEQTLDTPAGKRLDVVNLTLDFVF